MNKKENTKKINRKENFALLLTYFKGSKLLFLISMLSATLSALADMVGPQIVRMAVDNALGGQKADYAAPVMRIVGRLGGFEYLGKNLWIMALALVAVALTRALSQYIFRVSSAAATETVVQTMRNTLFSHIERLPFSWHMTNHTGDIIQRCTSDISTFRNFISEQLTHIIRIIILIVLAAVFMFSMNVPLALIAMAPVPVVLSYSVLFYNTISKAFRECDENEGILSTMAQENLTGVRVVRAFGREASELEKFEKHNDYYTGLWAKLATVMARYWTSQDIITGVQLMLVVVFGAVFCIQNKMSSGEYIAFISYSALLTWPVRMLGRMISEMSKAEVSIDRINDIMRAKEECDAPDAVKPSLNGDIVFNDVSFAYDNCPELLHHVSFTVKAGTTLGILGGTGSGKSTMMLLLDKMYDLPDGNGSITVNGVDIRNINTEYLRSNIGMVLQEPYLFSRSLQENIGITGGITLSQIRDAAKAACLDDTIMGFSKGYDTFVGERGVTLSGGQKQRAAIARMLTRRTPVMVFDDSLSAVDTETDAKIRAGLEARFGTATIILISHRISTLSKADNILVVDGGRIVEQGTHEELKSAGGIYQKIYEIQYGRKEEQQ